MSKRKFSGNVSGKGYYIALILCAVAIGISGYLYYKNANDTPTQLQSPTDVVNQNEDVGKEHISAVATQPGGMEQQPQQTAPTTPKVAIKTAAPVEGSTVAPYAMDTLSYNQTTRDWRVHNGIDIAAEAGTKVTAAADGTVYTVYEDDTMGTTVVIRHEEGYTTKYASLAQEVSVAAGDTVTMGQTIGTVGQTALLESAVGDHVHFSVTCNGETMDPAEFLTLE